MPGGMAGTGEIMKFLAEEISEDTYVNVMEQYSPSGRVNSEKFEEINRRVGGNEFEAALDQAREAGLWRFDERRSLASFLVRGTTGDS